MRFLQVVVRFARDTFQIHFGRTGDVRQGICVYLNEYHVVADLGDVSPRDKNIFGGLEQFAHARHDHAENAFAATVDYHIYDFAHARAVFEIYYLFGAQFAVTYFHTLLRY